MRVRIRVRVRLRLRVRLSVWLLAPSATCAAERSRASTEAMRASCHFCRSPPRPQPRSTNSVAPRQYVLICLLLTALANFL